MIGRQLQDADRLRSYGIMPEVAFDVVTHQKGDSPADVIAVILLGALSWYFVGFNTIDGIAIDSHVEPPLSPSPI